MNAVIIAGLAHPAWLRVTDSSDWLAIVLYLQFC